MLGYIRNSSLPSVSVFACQPSRIYKSVPIRKYTVCVWKSTCVLIYCSEKK